MRVFGRANVIALVVLVLLGLFYLVDQGDWGALILIALLASPIVLVGTLVYYLINRMRARR